MPVRFFGWINRQQIEGIEKRSSSQELEGFIAEEELANKRLGSAVLFLPEAKRVRNAR